MAQYPPDWAAWQALETSKNLAPVAFGALAAPGYATIGSITGTAALFVWGSWDQRLLFVERSTDSGATWKQVCAVAPLRTFDSGKSDLFGLFGDGYSGTALYRLRLDAPFPGGVVNWSVMQGL